MNLTLWKTRFGEYLQVRQFAARTVQNYVAELKPFFEFLESIAVKDLASVTRDVIEEYRARLCYADHNGQKLTAVTQGTRLAAIKAFTRYLSRERFLLVDPAAGVELPRVPRFTPPILLSEEEAKRLMETPDTKTFLGLRDRAILEVLYGTGLRNAELCHLTLEEIDLARKEIRLKRGKGGKGRVLPLGDEAASWLGEYLERSRPILIRAASEPLVFLSCRGMFLPRASLGGIVRRTAQRAGIEKRVTVHSLRHCYATHMLAAGAGVRHLQTLLGHESLATTQRYTKVEVTDLRIVLQNFHPRERGTNA